MVEQDLRAQALSLQAAAAQLLASHTDRLWPAEVDTLRSTLTITERLTR